ncbi:hypothetical protein AM500_10690 [Bacillus sp. FJAT-18017]|uniref:hypothetical protein n=1 Tax=Bacillus sp. FJAT-18017 TaxID=1705566 RepID=UPI0006AF79E2|nr:hypothetical protein [Bacillus sp. FJAT-18017]ALC90198.1 hypothetical protein AM500_10690 [Bacillus sp. FJAT-18017]
MNGGGIIRIKRLKISKRKTQYLKLIALQFLAIYYLFVISLTLISSTNPYFSDKTYGSIEIKNKDHFYGEKDSSSLASVKAWIECPKVYASFINKGGDMFVDTTWSVYKQIEGNNWNIIGTYPLKALKSKETRVLEYTPKESGTYRFVVQQVPTHPGNSQPKIETSYFDYNKCQSNKASISQNKQNKKQTSEDPSLTEEKTENQVIELNPQSILTEGKDESVNVNEANPAESVQSNTKILETQKSETNIQSESLETPK